MPIFMPELTRARRTDGGVGGGDGTGVRIVTIRSKNESTSINESWLCKVSSDRIGGTKISAKYMDFGPWGALVTYKKIFLNHFKLFIVPKAKTNLRFAFCSNFFTFCHFEGPESPWKTIILITRRKKPIKTKASYKNCSFSIFYSKSNNQ